MVYCRKAANNIPLFTINAKINWQKQSRIMQNNGGINLKGDIKELAWRVKTIGQGREVKQFCGANISCAGKKITPVVTEVLVS